ncbi:hypothetical protein BpHYR1_001156 [Brachionus plicatilis]|uniref:Uncharacterized protein n=1 Tax=Brachionus plicatilis TaxID=10195 RepID=A0A3M7RL42_BRAPC|nr:hypothetical protein BpHYR1_001156 [Brachionus plicatilis]
MNEIYRVLKPGGVCIFMEHSIDNENKPRKYMQKVIEPAFGDCKFLDMKKVLSSGPYDQLELKKYRDLDIYYVLDKILALVDASLYKNCHHTIFFSVGRRHLINKERFLPEHMIIKLPLTTFKSRGRIEMKYYT